MSRLLLAGAMVLATVLATSVVPAGNARAETPPMPKMPGWSSRQAPTGTVFFSCQKPECGGGTALVSMSPKLATPDMTLDKFQAIQGALNARIMQQVPGVRVSTPSPAMMAEIQGVRVFTAQRDHATTSGENRAYLSALLVGPTASISVVSDAPDRDKANANFRQFLPVLVKLAQALR